jgi:hypothetical protein
MNFGAIADSFSQFFNVVPRNLFYGRKSNVIGHTDVINGFEHSICQTIAYQDMS